MPNDRFDLHMKIKSNIFQVKREKRDTKGREIGKTEEDRETCAVLHLG